MSPLIESYQKELTEAGVDEAGRGCLAGPVAAAAVILPANHSVVGLNESKRLTPKRREHLRESIRSAALCWHVAFIGNDTIDEVNILRATWMAMHESIAALKPQPRFIIVDGNSFIPYGDIPHKTIIGGDALYASIAAASILAKTFRDQFMEQIDLEYPEYGWKKNKGYPTKEHLHAISRYGLTRYHRKSFGPSGRQLSLGI